MTVNAKILFYGGTGQCKVMRSLADRVGKLCAVLDDTENMDPTFTDVKFFSGSNCLDAWKKDEIDWRDFYFLVAIGNPNGLAREKISLRLIEEGLKPISLIHDSAIIDSTLQDFPRGSQVHAGVIINYGAKLGEWCILNTRSLLEHDSVLGKAVELGPGVTVCGQVEIGDYTWIGAGATVKNGTKIGKNCIIGAGSVVIENVPDNTVVVGVPAKFLKENKK